MTARAKTEERPSGRSPARPGIAAVMVSISLGLLGCGGSHTTASAGGATKAVPQARFTEFVTHAGLAFGVFHSYVLAPFTDRGVRDPQRHKAALTKARTATLTAYREVVQAKRAAAGDAKLRPLLGPFAALEASLYDLRGRLKRGAAVSTAIATVNATIVGIENTAHASGIIISERTATPR